MALPDKIDQFGNLTEVLCEKVNSQKSITFIESTGDTHLLYKDVFNKALRILGGFQLLGVKPGNELVFQFKSNLNFVTTFWACLLGGFVPVPITVPESAKNVHKIMNVWKVLKTPFLIINESEFLSLRNKIEKEGLDSELACLEGKTIFYESIENNTNNGIINTPKETDIALIQFSSGSTSTPKGVKLTHKNLITNLRAIINGVRLKDTYGSFYNWMPLTHDMGLIGLHLVPVMADVDNYIMPPELFIRNPLFWLKKITEYKPMYTACPNFGYRHVMKVFRPEKNSDIDLSSLVVIFNGAEPISAEACNNFIEVMKPFGLKESAIYTVYGLAEATVAVAFPEPYKRFAEVYMDRNSMGLGCKIRETGKNDPDSVCLVEVGSSIDDCFIRIVDQNGVEMQDRVIGRIQVRGENVTGGYYNNIEATENVFDKDGWLDTGDLGFLRDGNLVITGRAKDIIFVNGNTYYAHDIEFICEEIEEFKVNKVAACGIYNPELQKEEIVCFVLYSGGLEVFVPLAQLLAKHIVKRIGVGVSHVIPISQLPVTESGKTQRYKLKEAYLNGEYSSIINELSMFKAQK